MQTHSDSPIEVPIHHVSMFDFDDAFSENETNDFADHFSADAIRADLARNMPPIEPSWSEMYAPSHDPFAAENSSVSTLDINGDGSQRSRSESSAVSFRTDSQGDEIEEEFSRISLSESNSEEHPRRGLPDDEVLSDRAESPPVIAVTEDSGYNTTHFQDYPAPVRVPNFSNDEDTRFSPEPSPEPPLDSATSTQSLPVSSHTTYPTSQQPVTINNIDARPASFSSFPPLDSQPALSQSVPSTLGTPQKPPTHKPNRSTGPSAFEKVRSKTRPTFLPPKSREEDDKHMADWEVMMKQSRHAAEKKRKALRERRLERERRIEDSIVTWDREIVPDWRVVHKQPALRRLWWRGIPTKLRASMWERAVGNALALSKDHYRICLSRAKRALHGGVFPQSSLSVIEEDITTTLPALHIFHRETGPLYDELKDMLCAWVVSRSDEGLGYTLGAAKIAAMLLLNMPVQQAFIVMRNLLERHCMRSFFGGEASRDDVEAYYRIFDTLLADGMPKIYFNFKQHQISPSAYLIDWILSLFLDHLPFEACARIWDVLLLEGDSFLYRTALAILAVLEPRLFFPDRTELLELLKGENKAAIEVAKRDGRALDGGKYEIYGVDEETLWERIDGMEEWWKESTWQRLLQRELPDL